jgi:hypothetical protein
MEALIARQEQVVEAISTQLLKYIVDSNSVKDYANALAVSIDKLNTLRTVEENRHGVVVGPITGPNGEDQLLIRIPNGTHRYQYAHPAIS